MAMLGGVVLQLVLERARRAALVDRHLINRISGAALDLIIVAALGTLSLEALGGNLGPFLALAVAGIIWNVGAFLVLAPRIADPPNRSGGLEAFGYKQLLFEPVVGGGLFTAASVPLIAQLGPVPVLIGTAMLMLGWIVLGLTRFGPDRETVGA
jgi:glutamate:Na+ symporter, ESS family